MHREGTRTFDSQINLARRTPIMHEGWILKKRRKVLQGFAKRYFVLYESGILSYSFNPGEPVRDQISLAHAAISTAPYREDIHIDAGTATFHLKCLNTEDFAKWMAAMRKFIATEERAAVRRLSFHKNLPRIERFARTNGLIDEMGVTIHQLEDAFHTFSQDDWKKRFSSVKSKSEKQKEHGKHTHHLGIFKKSASNNDNSLSIESLPLHQIQAALDSLKSQHAALSKSVASLVHVDDAHLSTTGTLLQSMIVEEPRTSESSMSTPNQNKSLHNSVQSISSDVWYDAPELDDGPEEFLLDINQDDQAPGSRIENQSMVEQDSASIADTDSGEVIPTSKEKTFLGQVVTSPRIQLPSLPPADEGSLFTVLKRNIGKDLSSVALPVTFNEPLTLLQRAAEEMEYFDLLTQAAKATDPVERINYIAAFAVSSYAHTRFRSGRKGFNPMLAETFEDSRMNFIAEKVSHNPVIIAYHADGEGWELYATSAGKTKFWGKSLEIIPIGVTHVKIGKDHFTWKKPSSFMRNLMMGPKYLEHCGKMTIDNMTTNARCVLDFKESGVWTSGNIVSGAVYSPSGGAEAELEGKWDQAFSCKEDSSHYKVLWRINQFPKTAIDYYGFTSFGITLNEMTMDLERQLPPTDSRMRPDVKALENGNLDKAESEKLRVEEAQRERRRQGKDRIPRWFEQVGDEWIYTGEYWEARKRGWKGIEPLW